MANLFKAGEKIFKLTRERQLKVTKLRKLYLQDTPENIDKIKAERATHKSEPAIFLGKDIEIVGHAAE